MGSSARHISDVREQRVNCVEKEKCGGKRENCSQMVFGQFVILNIWSP